MMIRPFFNIDAVEYAFNRQSSIDTMLVDKIGLRVPTRIIDPEKRKLYSKNNAITILIQNENVSEICVHDQWLPYINNHLSRVSLAINHLIKNGTINTCSFPLSLCELEIAFDFYYIKPNFIFNDKAFINVMGTRYSKKDYHQYNRFNNYGRKVSNGVQCSFIKYYNKGLQLGVDFNYNRLEFRFQGKYRKPLEFQYLNGNTQDVIKYCYHLILKNCKKILNHADICIEKSMISQFSFVLRQLLSDIGVKQL